MNGFQLLLRSAFCLVGLTLMFQPLATPGEEPAGKAAVDTPAAAWTTGSAKVVSVRTVARDGWYNSFTDLTYWKSFYWLSYRQGTAHHAANSVEVVLRSNDLRSWVESRSFESPYGVAKGSAAGGGHFCTTEDRLYMFLNTRHPIHMFVSSTADGLRWSNPERLRLGESNPYTWRVREHGGKLYSAVAKLDGPSRELDLIVSKDGVHWTQHARIASEPPEGVKYFTEESELHWRPDGELWCVVRTSGAHMYWASPPYTQWQGGVRIHQADAPTICATGETVYLAGGGPSKKIPKPDEISRRSRTTNLYRLTRGSTELLVSFPTGGDASYPGLISLAPGKLIMSFYSDVAYQSGQVKPKHYPHYEYKLTECDIFVTEIEVEK